jgi:hypothetical protein
MACQLFVPGGPGSRWFLGGRGGASWGGYCSATDGGRVVLGFGGGGGGCVTLGSTVAGALDGTDAGGPTVAGGTRAGPPGGAAGGVADSRWWRAAAAKSRWWGR